MSIFLLVLLLDASLALRVDEATTGAGASLATEHAALARSGASSLGNGTANAEEDHGEEVGGKGCPSPSEGVGTEMGALSVATEGIAALDEACTEREKC
jgi:hypothetical protein